MIKKSFNKVVFVTILCACAHLSLIATPLHMLYMGSIQFPRDLEELPVMRVYHCGHKIKCEAHNTNKYMSFAIPGDRQRFYFDIIITPKISYKVHELNTIKYLTIPQEQAYTWYRILLVKKAMIEGNKGQSPYGWEIHKLFFGHGSDRRIPDDAIIICYDPNLVEDLTGGNAIDLPTITIKSNVVDLVGSEHSLHEKSIELLLASLDVNALHSTIEQELHHGQKTVLAMNK
ncbi:MAG: hypothetical protein ACHQVS_02965 [Candidatus Babeliales bacterium]